MTYDFPVGGTPGFDELLGLARAADPDALGRIWRALNPRVVAYLSVRAKDDAEDLASETWISVAKGLDDFRGDERKFEAFVFTIARRRLIDRRRADRRRPALPASSETLERIAPRGDAESDAHEKMAERELVELVKESLPKAQAEVFFLRVIAGLDVARTAEVLGKRPGTVRVLQHRALAKLAEVFTAEAEEAEASEAAAHEAAQPVLTRAPAEHEDVLTLLSAELSGIDKTADLPSGMEDEEEEALRTAERRTAERRAAERRTAEREAEERQAAEREAEERRTAERRAEERRVAQRRVAQRRAAVAKAQLAREASILAAEKARVARARALAAEEAVRASRDEIAALGIEILRLEEARRAEARAREKVRDAEAVARQAGEEVLQLEEEARRLRDALGVS